jgi:hypothetical protein
LAVVRSVDQPDVTEIRTWSVHERIAVKRATAEEANDDATRTKGLIARRVLLLVSTATAYAECAWVVWQVPQIQNPSNPELANRISNIMDARGTEDECREMSNRAYHALLSPRHRGPAQAEG